MYCILFLIWNKLLHFSWSWGPSACDFLDWMILMTIKYRSGDQARVRNQGKDVTNPRPDRPDCADWISGTIPSPRHVTALQGGSMANRYTHIQITLHLGHMFLIPHRCPRAKSHLIYLHTYTHAPYVWQVPARERWSTLTPLDGTAGGVTICFSHSHDKKIRVWNICILIIIC